MTTATTEIALSDLYGQNCAADDWENWANTLRNVSHDIDQIIKEQGESKELIAKRQGLLAWCIGDWLLAADRLKIKKSVVKKKLDFMFATRWSNGNITRKYAKGTLNNFKTVCKAIPASRRRENVGFSLHLEIAKLTEAADQERMLDSVEGYWKERGKQMSVRDLKKTIADLQKVGMLLGKPTPDAGKKAKPVDVVVRRVPQETYELLQRLSTAIFYRQKDNEAPDALRAASPGDLLYWMAKKWCSEHKDEMAAFLRPPATEPPAPEQKPTPAVNPEPEPELATNNH
jgi:hypothetical protein